MNFVLGFRGSVNRWECDENDHLNVRFYNRMVWESLHSALPALGVDGDWRLHSVHQRYLAEARLATPIAGYCALVAADAEGVTVLVELRNPMRETVLASFVCVLHGARAASQAALQLPKHAGARGIVDGAPSLEDVPLSALAAHGPVQVGSGVFRPEECAADGVVPFYAYMGRISDAMPNLWARLQTEEEMAARSEGFQGGAVLEYRMAFHGMLRAGGAFEVWSGVRHVAEKTQQFEHLLYDSASGACIVSAQAIAVVLDLGTRRSVVIPESRRARMQALQIH